MRYLSISEVFELHNRIISSSGGSRGIRDLNALESAVNQPRQSFDQNDLYPDIVTKAAALCFSLVMNHPFVDGNKRVGHAAMETFLILNGYEIIASVDEQERVMLELAAGKLSRIDFSKWLNNHTSQITNGGTRRE
ncbi:Death on curing protein, Doc toxin [Olavius sp. associated proteobacterium Delta 1]|nr:Death on curing protein, Doc toxin [Olavius sp. associated proteobacterium Delta 1]